MLKSKRMLLISSFLSFLSFTVTGYCSNLLEDITSEPTMHVGLAVMDPATGKMLTQYQANQYFHPASTTKLFTAIAAMLQLGKSYQFNTQVTTIDKAFLPPVIHGNVYIKFVGDPSFSAADLKQLLASMQQKGVHKITGNIVLDNTLFPQNAYALGVFREDDMWNFGAKADSIIINENSFHINFNPDTTLSEPKIKNVETSLVKVHSKLAWSNSANEQTCTFRAIPEASNVVSLEGCLPVVLMPTIYLAIPNPSLYAADLVRNDLKALGIQLNGKILTGSAPQTANRVIVEHHSASLSILLTMLKKSDNLYASAISKTLGDKLYHEGTEKAGVAAIHKILGSYQLPSYFLENGSGTSLINLITPATLTQLLYCANQNKTLMSDLILALPIWGVDGTLQKFPSEILKGKVYAKTGSLTHIDTMAGFINTQSGKTLIFNLMIENATIPKSKVKAFQTKILEDLYLLF